MALVQRASASARQIAANRRNALKSTGPRTRAGKRRAALNSLKHGWYATTATRCREAMTKLGEDPDEQERLEEALLEAWRPADALEAMLVRDLAGLYWNKCRSARALAAIELRALRRAEFEREKSELLLSGNEATVSSVDKVVVGLRRARDCDEKFEESARILEEFEGRVERRAWSRDAEKSFESLYGLNPTRRGSRIIGLYKRLTQAKPVPPLQDEASYEELKKLIAEEREQVAKEYDLYKRERAASLPGLDQYALKPLTPQWSQMLSQETALDRQIEGKVRLLLQLRNAGSRHAGSSRPGRPGRRASTPRPARRPEPLGGAPAHSRAATLTAPAVAGGVVPPGGTEYGGTKPPSRGASQT